MQTEGVSWSRERIGLSGYLALAETNCINDISNIKKIENVFLRAQDSQPCMTELTGISKKKISFSC
jgi:hypothetical protein